MGWRTRCERWSRSLGLIRVSLPAAPQPRGRWIETAHPLQDDDGIPDEVEEVGTVFWFNHDLIFLIFSFYACRGTDPLSISWVHWNDFIVAYTRYIRTRAP